MDTTSTMLQVEKEKIGILHSETKEFIDGLVSNNLSVIRSYLTTLNTYFPDFNFSLISNEVFMTLGNSSANFA